MHYKGIIFDFDGTIFDSEVPEYETWVEIFKQYKANLPISEWAKCVGSSNDTFDIIAYLEKQIDHKVDAQTIFELQRKLSDDRIAKETVLPGVTGLIQQAEQIGIRLAIASSSPHEWVNTHLTRLGLIHHFEVICTADDVYNVKPDPELFLCAANRLGLAPEQVIVIEDSPNGITAALQAGMVCIVVPNGVTRHLDTSHATLKFTSLAYISLESLLIELSNH